MTNLLAEAAPSVSVGEMVFGAVALTVGATVAARAGAFRRRNIAGPARMAPEASTLSQWMAIVASLAVQIVVAGLVGSAMLGPQPATPKFQEMTFHQQIVLTVAASGASLLTLIVMFLFHRPRWRISKSPLKAIKSGLIGAAAIIPIVVGVTILTGVVWYLLKLPAEQEHALLTALNNSHAMLDRWLVIASAVIIAPLNEELLFRGNLQTAIRQLSRRPWLSVIVTSIFFAAAHQSLWMSIPLFTLAVGLGYLYERTGNLFATMFVHGAFNAVMIAVDLMSHAS